MNVCVARRQLCHTGGKDLFGEWVARLRDRQGQLAVLRRVGRIVDGNFGDHKFCRDGVWELCIPTGPGYRVYYGQAGTKIVLLLCGGDKSTQSKDIDLACSLWNAFRIEVERADPRS